MIGSSSITVSDPRNCANWYNDGLRIRRDAEEGVLGRKRGLLTIPGALVEH